MTTPSNPWGDERRRLSHQLQMRGQYLGRRQARRLSRSFAQVGVHVPPKRLQQLVTGTTVADRELTDVNFALIATQYLREKKAARTTHLQRRCRHAVICAGLILVALNFLFCIAYLFFTLTLHAAPM
ncbi:hypothetical protein AO501_06240 [Mycobacterium gordonae]|uniref:Uncharacterized protein n=1 Tax=Mycobacterium gordonae TaxID=1778 RepID=A0A0Q2M005_MYCGO|nr:MULTISPECIES: hypothetical protein [Mycobacterium]KQH81385.1 hypothetical protein AO501_06240 [Mycobacterium gordonae]MDP7731006.1 hypothetical protein [Mycobacterium sp. TY813]